MHEVFVPNKLRERQSSPEIENSWEISYGDMITLLLAFFVMFFNIKNETINMKLIKKDIDKHFSEKTEKRAPSAASPKNQDIDKQKVSLPIISSQVQNSLKIKSNIEGQNVLVEFPGVEFFKSGKTKLTSAGQEALTEFTSAISNHLGSFRLVVRGHTDNKPLKMSRFQDNLELSAARSISAIRFMNKKGIATHFMRIAGYGESDGSRDIATDSNSLRKISIVLEPLEYTEKHDSRTAQKDERSKKSIEDLKLANLESSKKQSSINNEHPLKMYVADVENLFKSLKVSEKYQKIREPATYARWIENSNVYRKAITWWVVQDLKSRGYKNNQIQKMIEDLEFKKNEKQGKVP